MSPPPNNRPPSPGIPPTDAPTYRPPSPVPLPPLYDDGQGSGHTRFYQASRLFARLHRYHLLLRKHWWIMPLAVCIVLGPVTFYTLRTPSEYESNAKMWMSGKLNIPEGKLYSEELGNFMGTQAELLRSSTIRERALARIRKEHPDWTLASTNNGIPFEFRLEVKESPKAAFLDVRAVGPEPASMRAFLNAVMEEYLAFKKEIRTHSSDTTLASITEQVTQLEKDLKKQQEQLYAFQTSNNVVFLQEQGNSAGSYLANLNKQLAGLRTEFQLLQLLTPEQLSEIANKSGVSPGRDTMPGEIAAREMVANMAGQQGDYYKATQQIQMLKARRMELAQFLRPNHPKMVKLDEEIASQEKMIDIFKSLSLDQLESRRQSIQLQIQNLEETCKQWDVKALEASRKMAEFDRIRQDVQRTQGLYDRLLGVIQSVDVNKSLEQEGVSIMERASEPRTFSQKTKNLLLGLIAGLFTGFAILYLIERFDDKFASIGELRNHFDELVVGQIPEIKLDKLNHKLPVVHLDDERHVFVESFRNIRSSLLFMLDAPHRPKTILVTSSIPNEGKTTVVANLAVTMALSGSRVLLIDGDLRRTGLHKLFDVPEGPGLAEILEQRNNHAQCVVPTQIKNLSLIPAGDAEGNPGELFLSPSADVFLREIYPQFDYILLDSAPVLATDDTTSLAPKLDGVLFVVRGDFTSARMAREALDLLHQRQVNVIGLIFNRAVTSATEYYYYYRYSDYYYRRNGKHGKRKKETGDRAPVGGTSVGGTSVGGTSVGGTSVGGGQ